MDADFCTIRASIPSMLDLSRAAIRSSVHSMCRGRHTQLHGESAKPVSRGANTFAKVMLGLQAKMARRVLLRPARGLQAIDVDSICRTGKLFLIEMIFYGQRRGYSVGEVRTIFRKMWARYVEDFVD